MMKIERLFSVGLLIIALVLGLLMVGQVASAAGAVDGQTSRIVIAQETGEPIVIEVQQPETIQEIYFIALLAVILLLILGGGFLIRNELIKAHESIPPEALQILKAMGMEALSLAKGAAARTPNTIDDKLVKLIDDLIAGKPPGHVPPPEPDPDPPAYNRQPPFLDSEYSAQG